MPTNWDFVRIGGGTDGGYVLPAALDDIGWCLSAGVDDLWKFEDELHTTWGVPSFMIDGSQARPRGLDEAFDFEQKWLSSRNGADSWTLRTWVDSVVKNGKSTDLLLQMDIEGSEYRVVRSTPRWVLRRFRIIVAELHDLEQIGSWPYFLFKFSPFIRKLSKDFAPVHLHANNCCGTYGLDGEKIPRVLEVTWLRKDYLFSGSSQESLTGQGKHLDRDNVYDQPSIELQARWPDF